VGEQGREGWTFLDAWETGGDGSPGSTMMKTNPSSVPLLRPNLRWDHIFLNWPSGPGGVGHPLHSSWHRGRRGGPRGAARGV